MDIKTPLLAADCVAVADKKILLVKRSRGAYLGYWALPGGFVERGERLKDAAAREVREETGLEVAIQKIIGIYDDPKRDPRFHAVSVAFLCSVKGGSLRPQQEEVSDVRFFSVQEIKKLKIAFDHRKIIMDGLKMQGRKA